jgi:hypothetical protein
MQISLDPAYKTTVPGNGSRHISAFLVALALFVSLNLFLNYRDSVTPFTKLSLDALHFDYHGTEFGAETIRSPNLVLVGSSLFLYPMWRIDQADGANEVDSNHYHYARSLDRQFAERNIPVTTYSLATGGAMMSDSFLLLTHYLKHHPAPHYVILDCAPRSFYDGGTVEPDATPIFKCCFTPTDYPSLSRDYLPSLVSKLNYWGCNFCFMYHHRRSLSENILQGKLDFKTIFSFGAHTSPKIDSRGKSVLLNRVDLGADTPARFEYSLLDYKARYYLINQYQRRCLYRS